ncbi:hypothetical protein CVT25_013671 [Psilocybe cyanescens]|uniref:Uncharacterized protein n=1 Tax=Psilocybe cyanescens TaxID=93625 RepID=A0A409WTC3_PSICY|nr:hypothetical protein CVT25_013671 [Psilocybe cyanescens]
MAPNEDDYSVELTVAEKLRKLEDHLDTINTFRALAILENWASDELQQFLARIDLLENDVKNLKTSLKSKFQLVLRLGKPSKIGDKMIANIPKVEHDLEKDFRKASELQQRVNADRELVNKRQEDAKKHKRTESDVVFRAFRDGRPTTRLNPPISFDPDNTLEGYRKGSGPVMQPLHTQQYFRQYLPRDSLDSVEYQFLNDDGSTEVAPSSVSSQPQINLPPTGHPHNRPSIREPSKQSQELQADGSKAPSTVPTESSNLWSKRSSPHIIQDKLMNSTKRKEEQTTGNFLRNPYTHHSLHDDGHKHKFESRTPPSHHTDRNARVDHHPVGRQHSSQYIGQLSHVGDNTRAPEQAGMITQNFNQPILERRIHDPHAPVPRDHAPRPPGTHLSTTQAFSSAHFQFQGQGLYSQQVQTLGDEAYLNESLPPPPRRSPRDRALSVGTRNSVRSLVIGRSNDSVQAGLENRRVFQGRSGVARTQNNYNFPAGPTGSPRAQHVDDENVFGPHLNHPASSVQSYTSNNQTATQANHSDQAHSTGQRHAHNAHNFSVSSSRTFGYGEVSNHEEGEGPTYSGWVNDDDDDIYGSD